MSGDQGVQLLWGIGAIVLVLSSLSLRRIGWGNALKIVATWLVLFGLVLVVVSYRGEISRWLDRTAGSITGRPQVVGGELRVPIAPDGHFWVEGRVGAAEVRFLVDSGATFTALSPDTIRRAGLEVDESGFPVSIQTANGPVAARRTRIERLTIGPIVASDIGAITSPAFQGVDVIGMNFLSRLASWRVEGETLILVPNVPDQPPS